MKKYSYIQIEQDERKPYQINITAQVEENGYFYSDTIGRFCFYDGEGSITLEDGTRKKYKRFSAMLNLVYNIDPMASMTTNLIEQVKEEVKKIKDTQQTDATELTTEQQETKNNETTETVYTSFNRSFPTYEEAHNYCINSDFDPSHIEQVEVSNSSPIEQQHNVVIEQPEKLYLYNQTFDTYMDAYNYAIKNNITVSMIISSKASITNERLQQLEQEYIHNKYNMTYLDMVEYLNHLQSIPLTRDSDDRIYKLKNMIERFERKQQRVEQERQRQQQMNKKIDAMLQDMYSKGMTKREIGSTITEYQYNNQPIYKWYSGITTEQMYDELLEVYNRHFINKNITEAS